MVVNFFVWAKVNSKQCVLSILASSFLSLSMLSFLVNFKLERKEKIE